MNNKVETFENLASYMKNTPSRWQIFKEWILSFVGVSQCDEKFFRSFQEVEGVSQKVDSILLK